MSLLNNSLAKEQKSSFIYNKSTEVSSVTAGIHLHLSLVSILGQKINKLMINSATLLMQLD